MNDDTNPAWDAPATAPATAPEGSGAGRTAQDVADWRQLTERVRGAALARGWTKTEASRRAGIPNGTFSQWYDGKYAGRLDTTNGRVRLWLDNLEEVSALASAIPQAPGFIETRTARAVIETLTYAQVLPEMAIVNLASGMGKSAAAEHFRATRPHVWLATMSPYTKTVYGMLSEIAIEIGAKATNTISLHRKIGEQLAKAPQSLLIIDEAQNLVDAAVDQLRLYLDKFGCGIVLLGNEEIYRRFSGSGDGPAYAQIKARIGKRLRRTKPFPEDIAALLDGWRIDDPATRNFLTGVGMKPGALRQIDKTCKLAGLLAAGEGEAMAEKHVRAAWANRAVED